VHESRKDFLIDKQEKAMLSKADGLQKTGHKRAFLNSTAVGLFDF
jgi:hypothetical protein